MTRRKLSHVVAAGTLAALMALPGPALAQPKGPRSASAGLWRWLAEVWSSRVSSPEMVRGLGEKQGMGIDPNGGVSTGTGGATGQSTQSSERTTPGTRSEASHGIS